MIDQQEQNKVSILMIIPRSIKCDVIANEVDLKPCCNRYVICVNWQAQCILPITMEDWAALSLKDQYAENWTSPAWLSLFLDPLLQALYLTMLIIQSAEHGWLVTDNH